MARWLDFSANNFKRTYVHGFLDISGGAMNIRSDNSLNLYSVSDDVNPTFSMKSDRMRVLDPSDGTYKDISNNKLIFLQNVNEDIQEKLDWLVTNGGGGGGGGGGGNGHSLIADGVTYIDACNNILNVYKSLIPDISSVYDLGAANNLFNELHVTQGYVKNDLEISEGGLQIKNDNSLNLYSLSDGSNATFSLRSEQMKVYDANTNAFYDISNSKLRFLSNVTQDISGKMDQLDTRITDLSLASVTANSASHRLFDENKTYVSGSGNNITVTGHVIPNIANGWSLGSLSKPFDNLYVTQSSIHFVDETDPNYLKESTLTVDNYGVAKIDSNILGVDSKYLVFAENNIVEIGKFQEGLANQPYTLDVTGKAMFRDDLILNGSMSTFENDVHIKRHLTVDGSINFLGEFIQKDTIIQVTEQMDLSNDGTGPALIVRQHGTGTGYHIAEFYDDASLSTVFKDGGDVSFNKSIRIGENLVVDRLTTLHNTVTINANQLNTGDISLNGKLFATGDVSFNSKLKVGGDASFNSDVSIDGSLNIGGVLIAENDVSMNKTLTVDGFTTINDSLFVTEDISLNGSMTIDGSLNLNTLTSNGTFVANGDASMNQALSVNGATTLNNTLTTVGDVSFNSNLSVDGNLNVDSNSVLTGTVGIGTDIAPVKVTIKSTDSIQIPVGSTAQRPVADSSAQYGYIRYNTSLSSYEGFGAGNAWGSLGGIKDVDQDTYITAEDAAGDDNDQLKFYTDGSQRMVIDMCGNVGINTTVSTNRLTINGTNSDDVPILGLRSGNDATAFNDGAQVAFGHNGSDDYQHFIHTRHNPGNNTNNAIDFYVSDGSQNNTVTSGSRHTMSIVSGSVGIGTTNPLRNLHVEGNSKQTGDASFNSNVTIDGRLNVEQTALIVGRTDISGELYTTQNTYLLSELHVNESTNLNGKLITNADVSMNEHLVVAKTTTLNDKLITNADVSMNEHLVVGKTATIDGKLITNADVSMNEHLVVAKTTTLNDKLITNADVSMNEHLVVAKTTTLNDKLTTNADVSMNEHLVVGKTATIDGKLITNADVSMNEHLVVGKTATIDASLVAVTDVSVGKNLFVHGKTTLMDDMTIFGNIVPYSNEVFDLGSSAYRFRDLYLSGSTIQIGTESISVTNNSFQLNDITVANNASIGGDISLNDHIVVGKTATVNGNTIIKGDASLNEHLVVGKTATIDGKLIAKSDVSLNANVAIDGSVTMDDTLTVEKDITTNEDLYVALYSYLNDIDATGNTTIGGDTSMQKLTVNGNGIFENDVHIKRRLTVDGSINFLGEFVQKDTIIQVTEQMDLSNDGTGPALIVRQHGAQPIASFYDDQTMSLVIKNGGDVSFNNSINVEQNGIIQGSVGIGTNVMPVKVTIDSTDAIKIPVGTTAERPAADSSGQYGYIRYNKTNSSYEGFGAGNAWGSLGGVKDVDQDTYISAENAAGDDNDQLKFFTAGTQQMSIDTNGDVSLNANLIVSNTLTIQQDLSVNGVIRMSGGGGGATSGAILVGTTAERENPAAEGMIRYNTDRNLAEIFTSSDIWSGVASYKTEQPPLMNNGSEAKLSSSVTVSWQKFPEVYKDAFTGQSYPIYLQTFVDISFTQLNGNNNSNGWKTIHIGNGNYNTSGSATTPLTSLTFIAATGRTYSNSTGYTLTFDGKPSTINLPVFTQDDLIDVRIYGVNNSGTAPIYIYIYEIALKRTGPPSAVVVTNFESFSKTQFQMDTVFDLDRDDATITSGITITDYDISYSLIDTQSKETVTDSGVQQRDNYDSKNNVVLNGLKPGAKYAVNLRARNALNTNGGPENNGFGEYGDISGAVAVATDFTNNGNNYMFIDTNDLNSVSHNGMEVTLTGNASINGHLNGINSRSTRTLLSANNNNSQISLDGTSKFYINYGKQGKTLDATTGNLVTATFNIKNTAGTSNDVIQYNKTAASNAAAIGASGNQYQFTSASSYTDKGKTSNYSQGFVYSSDFDCTNGNNNNTVFNANFPAATTNYYLNYSIASQAENQNQRIDESGSSSTSRTTNDFYVDDYSSTPNVSFSNDPTISVSSSTKLFGIPSVTQVQLTADYSISNFASHYIPYSSNRHSRVNGISKNGYSFGTNDKTNVYQNTTYTMAYNKSSNITSNRYDANTTSDFTVTVFYLNNSGTPSIATHTDNAKDVNNIGHIFRDSANTYGGATSYFFNGSNTISGAITTNNASFETTYSSNISSTLLYFNNRFVSGGYNATYNGQVISAFSNWSSGYAVAGPNYSSYANTGIGGFKWIVLNVTNKKSGNNVNLSNFRINNSTPNLSNFGNTYEAYISHDNKFGALDRVFDSGATLWYNDANNSNIAGAKSIFGALNTNGVDAFIDSTTTSNIYLIVGLKQNDNSYFTFS